MKVLMVDVFLPENNYALELACELTKITDLTLFCREDVGDIDSLVKNKKKLYRGHKPKLIAIYEYLRGIYWLRKELKLDYDVIHVQAFKFAWLEVPMYIKVKKRGKILVHTVHNVLPHEVKKKDRETYQKIYEASDVLVVHNERTKKQLMSEFAVDENKIAVIPHGIYGDMVPNVTRTSDKVRFMMFGIIREYKGLDILLKAISQIPEAVRDKCEFVIAGKQDLKLDPFDYVALAKKLEIEDCVKFDLRRIGDEELPELFANADACVFPYKEIYGSGALLMAYTYQKPVIASNVPTFIEETENGKTGLLFKNENPQSLAETIERFVNLDDQQRKSYSDYIAKLVNEKYNWAASAKKTVEAYEKALQNRKGK